MAKHARFKKFFISSILISITLPFVSSCANWLPEAHRQDVKQGNEIQREKLNKVHVGMKKSEIIPLLGNPTLRDPFHANRWDYIYRYITRGQEAEQSRVTLFFKDDKLIRIDDSDYIEPKPLFEKKEEE